jgi:hypothetical protein
MFIGIKDKDSACKDKKKLSMLQKYGYVIIIKTL